MCHVFFLHFFMYCLTSDIDQKAFIIYVKHILEIPKEALDS